MAYINQWQGFPKKISLKKICNASLWSLTEIHYLATLYHWIAFLFWMLWLLCRFIKRQSVWQGDNLYWKLIIQMVAHSFAWLHRNEQILFNSLKSLLCWVFFFDRIDGNLQHVKWISNHAYPKALFTRHVLNVQPLFWSKSNHVQWVTT